MARTARKRQKISASQRSKRSKQTPHKEACYRAGCKYFGHNLHTHLIHSKVCYLYAIECRFVSANANQRLSTTDQSFVETLDIDDEHYAIMEDSPNEDTSEDDTDEPTMLNYTEDHLDYTAPDGERYANIFTTEQYYDTRLCKILDDANAPHYLYKDIKLWAKAAYNSNYDFHRNAPTRSYAIAKAEQYLKKHSFPRPEQLPVEIKGVNDTLIPLTVTAFDFKSQLKSLLNDDALFGDLTNLDVNSENPFAPYADPIGLLNCVNAGKWYQNAIKKYVKNDTDFLLPIIFTYDETCLHNKTSKVAPLNFTTSILNQACRNQSNAWRTLMFAFDISCYQSSAESGKLTPAQKSQQRHDIFRVGMQSYVDTELAGGFQHVLKFGDQQKQMNIIVQVCFISGDMQGGDNLACCSISYSNKLSRICRKCNVPGRLAGDAYAECQNISMVKVKHHMANNDQDRLDRYNQYNVSSPWFELDYGGDRHGIFAAAMPVEALHSVELGLMAHSLKLLWDENIKNKHTQAEIDAYIRTWTKWPQQRFMSGGSDKTYPRLLWKDGITSLTMVKATHRVGFMLTIVLATLTKTGEQLFNDAMGAERTRNMREVFQLLLCYWKWLQKASYWELNDREARVAARVAIRQMLNRLASIWPRNKGQGWEISKFHEQIHVPDDIYRHGPPACTNTHVTEHQHVNVKAAARRTQNNRETLDQQLGQRIYEGAVIDAAYKGMADHFAPSVLNGTLDDSSDGDLMIPSTASSIRIQLFYKNYEIEQWKEKPPRYWSALNYKENGIQPHFLPDEAFKAWHDAWRQGKLPGDTPPPDCHDDTFTRTFTCVSEIKWKGQMFRASTKYRQTQVWFDWVVIRYLDDNPKRKKNESHPIEIGYPDNEYERSKHNYAPGRLVGFLVDHKSSTDIYALLKMCKFNNSKGSVFTTKWEDASAYDDDSGAEIPYYEVVSVREHFVRPCLMIPISTSNDTKKFHKTSYHEVWPVELWADQFH
jgi:hypothetical protein